MASTLDILKRLNDHGVEYVVVGGMAGVIHGSSLVTEDVDVCAPMTPDNLSKIVDAVRDLHPRHRMNPTRPPLRTEAAALTGSKNLYLLTDLGQVDFLSEISGLGDYAEVLRHTITVEIGDVTCRVLDLDSLIRARQALGSPKDMQAVAELRAIRKRITG